MARVIGIGGIFFKSAQPDALRSWYAKHLGIDSGEHGTMFRWRTADEPAQENMTVWSIFPESTRYFEPSKASMMINYIVEDLTATLAELRAAGVTVDDKTDDSEIGKFGWVQDPDGNRIELWEPPKDCT